MCVYVARDFPDFAPQRALHAEDARRWLTNRGQGEAFDMLDDILAVIREKGPCRLTDIALGASKDYGWGPRKPSGAAMEYLFRAGRLCISGKTGTQRHFDLAERVLPPECLAPVERDAAAFAEWYVRRRVAGVGLLWGRRGGAWQGYVVSEERARRAALARLVVRGELIPCHIEDQREMFYAVPEALAALDRLDRRPSVRFIAPLDNLLWDRDMLEALFGFRYRWEVYTPVAKRQYGYYVLPVLYGSRFVARFEPEPVNQAGCLRVKGWWWEDGVRVSRAILEAVEAALRRFARYLGVSCTPENMDAVRRGSS